MRNVSRSKNSGGKVAQAMSSRSYSVDINSFHFEHLKPKASKVVTVPLPVSHRILMVFIKVGCYEHVYNYAAPALYSG